MDAGRIKLKRGGSADGARIFETASEYWQMTADVLHRTSFSAETPATPIRPDIELWSRETRWVLELIIFLRKTG